MPRPEKRLPGQTNADHERRDDPNTDFLGTQSLHGGGNLGWSGRVYKWLSTRRDPTGQPPR